MNSLKYILSFIIAVLSSITTTAQTFYYKGDKKIPLVIQKGRKVILSNSSQEEPILPRKADKTQATINTKNYCLTVYEEHDSASPISARFKEVKSNCSVYDCYLANSLKVVPTGYIYVHLKSLADTVLLKSLSKSLGCIIEGANRWYPMFYKLRMVPGEGRNPITIANSLYETGYFTSAEPAFWAENMQQISYDTYTTDQWGLYNYNYPGIDISVSRAWNYSTGRNVKIAIIDGGVDIYHEDLRHRIYDSYNADAKHPPCQTTDAHGTRCAGIAAGIRNNNKGISGVAPDAMLMPVSIRISLNTDYAQIIDAIQWCWNNGADIISCSLELPEADLIENAIKDAVNYGRNGKGCIFVNSAGNIDPKNSTLTDITFPASLPEVIAVGNLKSNGIINDDSCYGPNMWVVAPGTNIISSIPDNEYNTRSGTSFACPHVAGVAALILQRNPYLGWKEVRDIIKNTATKVGPLSDETPWDDHYGYGLVNAYQAVINTPRRLK